VNTTDYMDTVMTLKVSPQGQITIPKAWRKALEIKPGTTKLVAYLTDLLKTKALTLQPKPKSWADQVAGTGKGLWGDSDEYIKKERDSWEKKWQ